MKFKGKLCLEIEAEDQGKARDLLRTFAEVLGKQGGMVTTELEGVSEVFKDSELPEEVEKGFQGMTMEDLDNFPVGTKISFFPYKRGRFWTKNVRGTWEDSEGSIPATESRILGIFKRRILS